MTSFSSVTALRQPANVVVEDIDEENSVHRVKEREREEKTTKNEERIKLYRTSPA